MKVSCIFIHTLPFMYKWIIVCVIVCLFCDKCIIKSSDYSDTLVCCFLHARKWFWHSFVNIQLLTRSLNGEVRAGRWYIKRKTYCLTNCLRVLCFTSTYSNINNSKLFEKKIKKAPWFSYYYIISTFNKVT